MSRIFLYLCLSESCLRMKLHLSGHRDLAGGVPVIGCRCRVCTSADRRDRRLRTSAMVETRGVRLVIDAGPDFRYQMLPHRRAAYRRHPAHARTQGPYRRVGRRARLQLCRLSAHGPQGRYLRLAAHGSLRPQDFDYAFEQDKYRGVPEIVLHEIDLQEAVRCGRRAGRSDLGGHHSERFTVTGYRIGALAYLTDFKTIPDEEVAKLSGVGGARGQCAAFRPALFAFQCRGGPLRSFAVWRRARRTSRTCRTTSACRPLREPTLPPHVHGLRYAGGRDP